MNFSTKLGVIVYRLHRSAYRNDIEVQLAFQPTGV